MAFDQQILQHYSHAVNIDHIRSYIWEQDLQDHLAVHREEDYLFTFCYDSTGFDTTQLHWHLDQICDRLRIGAAQ
jgi:hypothetical protein